MMAFQPNFKQRTNIGQNNLVFGPAWEIVYVFFGAHLNNALDGLERHVGKEQHFDHAHGARAAPAVPLLINALRVALTKPHGNSCL